MSVDAVGDDPVGDFVASMTDGMVTQYVLYVGYIAPDGDHEYWSDTMEKQPATTTLGIAEAVAAIEKHRIVYFDTVDDDR